MLKKMKKIIYLLLIVVLVQSCKQERIDTLLQDGTAPGAVSNATVENLSGAARITYKLPADKDVLYVKAVYTSKQGAVRDFQTSYYNNNLLVEGFGDTSAYEVKLVAVDRGGNASPALSVTVKPKTPPYLIVRKSLAPTTDFGGITTAYLNETKANMAIVVLANDAIGNFGPIYTEYTDLKDAAFSIRGLKDVDTKFGLYVRDRWGNISDTLITTLKPLFEVKLDPSKMKGLALPTDAPLGYDGQIRFLFDGVLYNTYNYYHTGDAARMPQWFTFDMGVTAKLSRLVWFMRDGSNYYSLHNPRKIEIWGSNDPAPDGSFTNWVLLTAYEQIKPSGLPNGQLSSADQAAALAGETVKFPLTTPMVRYIRFKTLSNWSNGTYVNFNEIYMYGAPQ
jgi:hypothetical protein